MKKLIIGFAIISFSMATYSQSQQPFNDSIKNLFDQEYLRLQVKSTDGKMLSTNKKEPDNVIAAGGRLKDLLVLSETPTEFDNNISSATRQLIANRNDPYILVLADKSIKEDTALDRRLHLKEKLLKALSIQTNLLTKNLFPYYNYNTKEKQLIKFVSVRSGNDMFTLAGMFDLLFHSGNQYIRDGNIFFQRNDDRDYTGSFLIEIGTDYLKTLRTRPLKTYQTLIFGFDVYTPYFKDSTIFKYDTSHNDLDRPHASFQYFGWSKKGVSRANKYRWESTIKFGKIGGSTGAKFQNALHQDISYSRRPRGWEAQISNGGRIGFSLEFKEEWLLKSFEPGRTDSWKNLNLSLFLEEKLGTYMTLGSLGLQLSNKNFAQNNHNFINHRIRISTGFLNHLMYRIAFQGNYVIHNTMLEGYGMFNTKEKKNDDLTPRSRYYLNRDQVRRITFVFNTTVSYTTRFATLFYNWRSYSPETRLSNIGIKSPASGKEMNIAKRWHHFAEIGFTFNVH